MQTWDIEDLWPQEDFFYLSVHQKEMLEGEFSFVEIHGLHDEPETWKVETGSPSEMFVSASICPACGWWSIDKQVAIDSPRQIWDLFFRSEGALLSLDLADIHIPLDEVRRYLLAKYESRFSIHPQKFEEVVASVFRNLGYEATVTAYSGDGGIDVVLIGREGERVGVQVKRYRGSIDVEQIRSLAR